MPVTKDRQARMLARRYQDVEDTLAKKGSEFGLPGPLQKLLARMVAYEPKERFQTPAELLEAVRQCRADLGGSAQLEVKSRVATGPRTLFVVETNEKLKDPIRDKFKEHGFRVLLSIDPGLAVRRFQEQPYHALIVDARTLGEDGVDAYNRVLRQADNMGLDVGAVLILSEKQTPLIRQAREHRSGAVLVDAPDARVTMKQLIERVYELTPGEEEPAGVEQAGS
jgi:serine/threonine-protein kinase